MALGKSFLLTVTFFSSNTISSSCSKVVTEVSPLTLESFPYFILTNS